MLMRALQAGNTAEPDLSTHDARPGDRFMLCSDGLTAVVADDTLRDMLTAVTGADATVAALIDLTRRGGAPDNVTCVVVDVLDRRRRPVVPQRRRLVTNAQAAS
jgi:protein phosphatase